MFVGCYTHDRGSGHGIAVLRTTGGVPSGVDTVIPAMSPSFVIRHPSLPVLYAVAEADTGGVAAWTLPDDPEHGAFEAAGTGESGGGDPCHMVVDASGRHLVTINFGGSICVHRLDGAGRLVERTDLVRPVAPGSRPHPRQDGPHPHMACLDGEDLLVTDFGDDAIRRYTLRDGRLVHVGSVKVPAGSGPRHLRRTESHWLVTAELSGTILVYAADWTLAGAVPASRSALASGVENLPSELVTSEDGRYLFVANRGPDTVSVFALGDGLPEFVTEVRVGAGPRHIAIDGDLLYSANQLSDDITTLRIDPVSGVPTPIASFAVGSPTCVLLP